MILEYWKSILNDEQKVNYDKIYDCIKNEKRYISCENLGYDEALKVYAGVADDHPELFYIPFHEIGIMCCGKEDTDIDFSLTYVYSHEEIQKGKEEINRILNSIKVTDDSDLVKERMVCDYMIKMVSYAIDNKYNQNAYQVLSKNIGQCSGIARAVKLLFDYVGVESIVLSGEAISNTEDDTKYPHAWNVVKIDGKHYHLDVTFMIGVNEEKIVPYKYLFFNYNSKEMSKTHYWDKSLVLTWDSIDREKESKIVKKHDDVFPEYRKDSFDKVKVISTSFALKGEIYKAILKKSKEYVFASGFKCKKDELKPLIEDAIKEALDSQKIKCEFKVNIFLTIVKIEFI